MNGYAMVLKKILRETQWHIESERERERERDHFGLPIGVSEPSAGT